MPRCRTTWTRWWASAAPGFPAASDNAIAIARALVRNPALLILDEATTALDPETEAGIVATVKRLTSRLTVLSISHQPAMQGAATVVYQLENGTARRLEGGASLVWQ